MTLDEESERATNMLLGKAVKRIARFREKEILIEFEDGARLFVDSTAPLEISIQEAARKS
ncbi:hypothetical protein [Sphingobium sp. AP50]|uniref:hypothetical protein n=1 Tax=Sphingobium sp. AP50 TaxID=1884369 RepID=UPI000B87073C|nr:hypothetical protein [Sphingobium sp. AP50]